MSGIPAGTKVECFLSVWNGAIGRTEMKTLTGTVKAFIVENWEDEYDDGVLVTYTDEFYVVQIDPTDDPLVRAYSGIETDFSAASVVALTPREPSGIAKLYQRMGIENDPSTSV